MKRGGGRGCGGLDFREKGSLACQSVRTAARRVRCGATKIRCTLWKGRENGDGIKHQEGVVRQTDTRAIRVPHTTIVQNVF
jgi:hypothetical protein